MLLACRSYGRITLPKHRDTGLTIHSHSRIIKVQYCFKNGKQSSGKRSRHMNIRYFFITDRFKQGEMTIGYCPASEMIGDHFTKPLQGALFHRFRAVSLNFDERVPDVDLAW